MPWSNIAAVNQVPFFGIANEASLAVPETNKFRFEEIYGQSITEGVISAYAGGGYHADGAGTDLFTLTTAPRTFVTYPMTFIARLPVASNQGVSPEILAQRMQTQAAAQFNAACIAMSLGLWQKGDGPDGLWDMIPSGNKIATSGITGTVTNIWFVNSKAISFGIGNGGAVSVSDITEETVVDPNTGKAYRAYVQSIVFRCTNILRDYRCAVALSYNAGKPLTLENMYAALAKQNDVVPFDCIFMSRASQAALRDLLKAEQSAMYVTLPTDFEGLPIVCTPNIGTVEIGS